MMNGQVTQRFVVGTLMISDTDESNSRSV